MYVKIRVIKVQNRLIIPEILTFIMTPLNAFFLLLWAEFEYVYHEKNNTPGSFVYHAPFNYCTNGY